MNVRLTDADQPQALTPYELTYSPAYRPSGAPINPTASRQELQERRTTVVEALTADVAIDRFERASDRMVTHCVRLQFINGMDYSTAAWAIAGVPA